MGYQESLSEEQAQLIYRDGDALEMVARMPGVCISAMNYQGKFGHRVSTHELTDVHDPAGPGHRDRRSDDARASRRRIIARRRACVRALSCARPPYRSTARHHA